MDEKILNYIESLQEGIITFTPRLLLAIVAIIIGFWIVKKLSKLISRTIEKSNVSIEVATFLTSIIDIVLKFIVLLVAAAILGFKISALIGVLAAAGFAVGLALQGFMGNFASGITIVFFKPYKVGDWVEVSEKFGRVTGIQIFNTTIITPGNKTLIIPNGQVTDNIITNFSTEGFIRLDLTVTMPYKESFPKIKSIILKALSQSEYILPEPAPVVGIEEYDSHSILVGVRPHIYPDNFWEAKFECLELIKAGFNENNIQVAYSEGIELGEIGD